jgi:predicted site-specific integrase-resolvase
MDGQKSVKFLKSKDACEHFGVSDSTLRRWASHGIVQNVRDSSGGRFGHRRYDVNSYNENGTTDSCNEKKTDNNNYTGKEKQIIKTDTKRKICYCRVSSQHQKDDLERQVKFMQDRYPEYEIIKDVGSGINFKRSGFLKLISGTIEGNVSEVVVAYKDRLCRFGIEILEFIFAKNNVKFVVLNDKDTTKTAEQELAEDLLSIVHIFSCRTNGKRKYKPLKKKSEKSTEEEKHSKET